MKKENKAGKKREVIMAENFSKLIADTKSQIQEAQRTPSRINIQKYTLRHIIFQLQKPKDKEETLNEARGGNLAYRRTKITITKTSHQRPHKEEDSEVKHFKY